MKFKFVFFLVSVLINSDVLTDYYYHYFLQFWFIFLSAFKSPVFRYMQITGRMFILLWLHFLFILTKQTDPNVDIASNHIGTYRGLVTFVWHGISRSSAMSEISLRSTRAGIKLTLSGQHQHARRAQVNCRVGELYRLILMFLNCHDSQPSCVAEPVVADWFDGKYAHIHRDLRTRGKIRIYVPK